jgi:hypothetical protein
MSRRSIFEIKFVYEPLPWQAKIVKVDKNRCRYPAWDKDTDSFYQCTRGPQDWIKGFRFCTQHAKMVRREQE